MSDHKTLSGLLGGLRAAVTVADEDYTIIHMNDLAIDHYADRGGETLLGTDLLDCHNASSQAKIRQMYARFRAGDYTATRYHEEKGDGTAESIVLIPAFVDGQFRGVAELMWNERREMVFEQ